MIDVVWLISKRGRQPLQPQAPLLVLFLVSLVILVVVLAVSTPPKAPMEVVEISSDYVQVRSIDDFLTAGSASAVTAVETHFSGYTFT